jgi:hypothetical protein
MSIHETNAALKIAFDFELRTNLLLRSGNCNEIADNTTERDPDGRLHVSGYVWASLLRRALDRVKGGDRLSAAIGKYDSPEGVSPLWCESSFANLPVTDVRPGVRIDRRWGSAVEGALYQEEIVPPGIRLRLNLNFFCDKTKAESALAMFAAAAWVVDQGIENIGGGWSYGFGRLACISAGFRLLDLTVEEDRAMLWRFDHGVGFKPVELTQRPDIGKPWKKFLLKAGVASGQLIGVHTKYPLAEGLLHETELPDSFVFARHRVRSDNTLAVEPVIPGKAVRQALLSVPIERKLRTQGREVCLDSAVRKKSACTCERCAWFGNGHRGGIVAVLDAAVHNPEYVVLNRVQLCEHSRQNLNLFNGEYLSKGDFEIEILVDCGGNGKDPGWKGLHRQLISLWSELKQDGSAPMGWHRLGATSTCTGQLSVTDVCEETFGGANA